MQSWRKLTKFIVALHNATNVNPPTITQEMIVTMKSDAPNVAMITSLRIVQITKIAQLNVPSASNAIPSI
jgi:hypothetical protein